MQSPNGAVRAPWVGGTRAPCESITAVSIATPNHSRAQVQQGSQSRSSPALQEAVRGLREGLIGEVYMARAGVPSGVHYDLWLGPAPKRGNQGIHEVDIARWGLGVRYPVKVSATGALRGARRFSRLKN